MKDSRLKKEWKKKRMEINDRELMMKEIEMENEKILIDKRKKENKIVEERIGKIDIEREGKMKRIEIINKWKWDMIVSKVERKRNWNLVVESKIESKVVWMREMLDKIKRMWIKWELKIKKDNVSLMLWEKNEKRCIKIKGEKVIDRKWSKREKKREVKKGKNW